MNLQNNNKSFIQLPNKCVGRVLVLLFATTINAQIEQLDWSCAVYNLSFSQLLRCPTIPIKANALKRIISDHEFCQD